MMSHVARPREVPPERVVVTGGAGFLGSHLCRALVARGSDVRCVDNLSTGRTENLSDLLDHPRFELVEADITEPLSVPGPVDLVLHLACAASPIDYFKLPVATLRAGGQGTYHLLCLARETGARVVLASTSEVYGDPLVHPQPEEYWGNVNPVGPRAVYDESKRFSEAMTVAFRKEFGLDTGIARIFNSYGPAMRTDDGRVVPTFITQALKGDAAARHGRRTPDAVAVLRRGHGQRHPGPGRQRRGRPDQHRQPGRDHRPRPGGADRGDDRDSQPEQPATATRPIPEPESAGDAALGVVHLDAAIRVVAANDTFCQHLGLTTAEIQGKPLPELFHLSVRDRLREHFTQLLGGRHGDFSIPMTLAGAGETHIDCLVTGMALRTVLHVKYTDCAAIAVVALDTAHSAPMMLAPAPAALAEVPARVLEGAASGLSTQQLASQLGLSSHGVEYHISTMLRRLKVPNRSALVARAYALDIFLPRCWPPRVRPQHVSRSPVGTSSHAEPPRKEDALLQART